MSGHRSHRAQALLEFALALPIFLLVVYGLMEASRWIFTVAAVSTASREAARYASASGVNAAGNLNYQDCAAIRDTARGVAFLVSLADSDITIKYDHGPGAGGTAIPNCTQTSGAQTNVNPNTGDRVIVTVKTTYSPLLPLVPFGNNIPIVVNSSRTITGTIDLNKP